MKNYSIKLKFSKLTACDAMFLYDTLATNEGKIVLDFSQVRQISSACVGAMLVASNKEKRITLKNVKGNVRETITLLNKNQLLTIN